MIQDKKDKRIVVIQSGWVFIGNYVPAQGGKPAYVDECKNISSWGTTQGLGEIALRGFTKDTIAYDVGVLVLDNPSSVLFTIKCSYDE